MMKQVDVLDMLVGMTEGVIEKEQEELALCEAMIAEIEADLAREDRPDFAAQGTSGTDQVPGI